MKNIKNRITSAIIAAITVLSVGAVSFGTSTAGILPGLNTSIYAVNSKSETVSYVNSSGELKTCGKYTVIDENTTKLTDGWYIVDRNVTINDRMNVIGDAYIIIKSGKTLTVTGGIGVNSGFKFNVYTQDGVSGTLYAGTSNGTNTTATSRESGIGGSGANVNIVGCKVVAKGGASSYGIQGNDIRLYWTNPTDTIHASSFSSNPKIHSPFINRKYNAAYYNSTVPVSSVDGVTLEPARAITAGTSTLEGGNYASFDHVNVSNRLVLNGDVDLFLANNSTLTASAGITVPYGTTLNIYSNGGKLYAGTTNGNNYGANDNCAGIGSERGNDAGYIIINEGEVYANGGRNAAGIGGGRSTVRIYGGTVNANGGSNGAGIGSGYNDSSCSIEIMGGKVTANGGSGAAGIGRGYGAGNADIKLSSTNTSDFIKASSYDGNINFQKTFYTEKGETATTRNINGVKISTSVSSFTVSFVTNGAGSVSSKTVPAGGRITLPNVSKSGYYLEGWYTDSSFFNRFNENSAINSSLTLYAKWVRYACTVSFDTNGGSYISPIQVDTNSYLGSKSPTPRRSGYLFDGWYTDRNFYYYFDPMSYRITEDITLYAKWIQSVTEYTVTFKSDGRIIDTETVAAGSYINDPGIPDSRIGVEWDGWYDQNGNYIYFPHRVDRNETLTAKWAPLTREVTLSFNTNGGSYVSQITTIAGDTLYVSDFAQPYRSGYTFDGWYYDSGLYRKVYGAITITENTTLYAGWIQDAPTTYTVTFRSNGGLFYSETVEAGSYIYDPGIPWADAVQGSEWDGWYDQNGSYGYFPHIVNSNETYTARWTNPYYNGEPIKPDVNIGSTFSESGIVAAIVGGIVVVGGGIAAGIAISKKNKKK